MSRLNKQVYVAQTVYKPGVHPFAHAGRLDCLGSWYMPVIQHNAKTIVDVKRRLQQTPFSNLHNSFFFQVFIAYTHISSFSSSFTVRIAAAAKVRTLRGACVRRVWCQSSNIFQRSLQNLWKNVKLRFMVPRRVGLLSRPCHWQVWNEHGCHYSLPSIAIGLRQPA